MSLAGVYTPDVRRRFVRMQGRGVRYLRAGLGPPVVLLHYPIASAHSQLPLLEPHVRPRGFAFDNPGCGDSDPLPKRNVRITDVADALQATLKELKMPRYPIFGTHTDGTVAMDLARRHSERVSASIVDGIRAQTGGICG